MRGRRQRPRAPRALAQARHARQQRRHRVRGCAACCGHRARVPAPCQGLDRPMLQLLPCIALRSDLWPPPTAGPPARPAGALDMQRLNEWLSALLQVRGGSWQGGSKGESSSALAGHRSRGRTRAQGATLARTQRLCCVPLSHPDRTRAPTSTAPRASSTSPAATTSEGAAALLPGRCLLHGGGCCARVAPCCACNHCAHVVTPPAASCPEHHA